MIESLKLKVNGVTIELTPEQAEGLRDELMKLTGVDKPVPVTPPIVIREYPYWWSRPYWYDNAVTCNTTEGSYTLDMLGTGSVQSGTAMLFNSGDGVTLSAVAQ